MPDSPNKLSKDKNEHELLRKMVKKFAESELEKDALKRDEDEYFDLKLFRKLGDLGLLGLCAEEIYGGSNLDALASVIVHEELSYSDPGFCLAYLAHSVLCVNNISKNGSLLQKKRYLPKLCSGEWIGAMAMSESKVGTDVLSMHTNAIKNEQGFLVNGQKMWITNGALDKNKTPADVLFLYAKVNNNISSFIVEKTNPGFSVGQLLKNKLGMRASNTAELVFDNCQLRSDQLVGNVGDSLIHMMKNLEIERLSLAAMSLGIAKRSLMIMSAYANDRTSFNQKLINFGQIQRYISESYAKYKACKAYVYQTARNFGINKSLSHLDSDGVKLITAQCAKEIADAAIQVLGGNGYMGEYVVERLWRDAKLLEIGGGTLEAHQKNMTKQISKNLSLILE